jgi:hypothetical protein
MTTTKFTKQVWQQQKMAEKMDNKQQFTTVKSSHEFFQV